MKQDDATRAPAVQSAGQNLRMRILAALVLIPVAIGVAYAGGWFWLGLVTLVAVGLYVEWLLVIGAISQKAAMAAGIVALAIGACVLPFGRIDAALAVIALGIVVVALLAPHQRGWTALGLCYASAALVGAALLRLDPVQGFAALMLVLLIVWVTDIGGYVVGRGIGGPKLWPRVSPNKTWAGAIGGFVASLAVAAGFAALGLGRMLPLLGLAAVLSMASQLGDLFESAVKRNFGVKDSSHIIPGHGGLLDRLDGFVFAVVVAAFIGSLRGGVDGVGRGLMVW